MAETVSKYKQTDKLKKIMTEHEECTMTCVNCYKQFSMNQDQVMALMLSGLQVECGKCDQPSTKITADGQTNDSNDKPEPTIIDEVAFTMTCTVCGETNTISSGEATEALTTGTLICNKCKSASTRAVTDT